MLVEVTGLAVCFAYYPLADRTVNRAVPVCALLAKHSPPDCVLYASDLLRFKSCIYETNQEAYPKGYTS